MAIIDDLNEDCLIEIFSCLDIRERQKLELVCKRWREINQIIWRSMRKFEYMVIGPDNPSCLIHIRNGLNLKSNNFSLFGGILRKFNGNLEKLAITTNIRYYQILDIPNWIFKLIIEIESINSLEIHLNNKYIYKECLKFLKVNNLQHLKISHSLLFKKLSTSVLDIITQLLLRAPRLETLHLSNIQISIQEINKITTLKSLFISGMEKSLALSVKKFNFINLESIHLLQCPYVKDSFIEQLVKDCKELCNVEIYVCDLITTKGLIPITTLPKLRYFGTSRVDDKVFDKLLNLESIVCNYLLLTKNTKKFSISNFLRRSPNLKNAKINVNGDPHLFYEYARSLGIVLNNDQKYDRFCFCVNEWKKQFEN